MKIVTVVGARPQFVKAAAISRAISRSYSNSIQEVIIHTGQHYDENMSKIFFDDLNIPHPNYNLMIGSGAHGQMTGRMLESIESILIGEKPDWVMIYGDTNSTLAGALAAVKLKIPIAHIESGLRSYNMCMPEEINRIISDRISRLLFCPTKLAVKNLKNEGITDGVYFVGDVMLDIALHFREKFQKNIKILDVLNLVPGEFFLLTCHRAENTDDPMRLLSILRAAAVIADKFPVVFPIHPRTKYLIDKYKFQEVIGKVRVLEPLSLLDMLALEQSAKMILTDSGGVQKEAAFLGVPCLTLRDETEWMETIDSGWNRLVGANEESILNAVANISLPKSGVLDAYGNGKASERILDILVGKS